jgi:hypothetical protein
VLPNDGDFCVMLLLLYQDLRCNFCSGIEDGQFCWVQGFAVGFVIYSFNCIHVWRFCDALSLKSNLV